MARTLGSITLDDGVNSWISELNIPGARTIQFEPLADRQGRVSRVKEDRPPLVIDARGYFCDGGGVYWRDWKAALLNQSRANFTLGDGTQYVYADVTEVQGTQTAAVNAFSSTPQVLYAWTAKIACYEPYARQVAPTLQQLGTLNTGTGSVSTTFSVPYAGTAYAEPTWQVTFVVPSPVTVTAMSIANAATGEQVNVTGNPAWLNSAGTPILAGSSSLTQWLLFDASGSAPVSTAGYPLISPNNALYGLLAGPTFGYGATIGNSSASVDYPFTGQVPTLIPNPSPTVPPTSYANSITVTITSTGALTSASLAVLAPARYWR
jgi:hypothetical protein